MNNGSCEFESHLGHQKVVGATALATFSCYPYAHPERGVDGEADTSTDPLRGSKPSLILITKLRSIAAIELAWCFA